MDDEKYQLILGNATKIPLADNSVDLVFASPPYEAQRSYGIGFDLRGQEWVDFMVQVFRESLRVSRGLVAMVVEGFTRNYRWSASPALLMADLHREGITLRKPPAFHRVGIPGSGGPDWLRNDYEFIICATNGGKLPWSDNTAAGHPPKYAPGGAMSHRVTSGNRVNGRNQWGGTPGTKSGNRKADGGRESHIRKSHVYGEAPPVKANPGNVIHCKVGGGLMGHPLSHENEAPFPETLADFFVRSFSPPNGVVLDCFSGSGTTVAAAVKAGRYGIGLDIRQSQVDLARRRMKSIPQTLSFTPTP